MQATAAADAFDPRLALVALWFAGALFAAAWFVRQQRRYLRSLGRLRARDGARIVQSDSEFAGPALVGAWRPRIVLPSDFDRRYDARERELILAHEHVHFARGDAWINALVVALRSLNWFNPLLHYAAAKFRLDQELACDAVVVARFPEARRQYADAMLKVQLAGQPRQELRLPVGCRWPSDRTLKERILMLKQSRPTRAMRRAGLCLVAGVTLAFAWTAWASQSPRPQAVSAGEQKQVAANLRIEFDGKPGKFVRIVNPLGESFEIADDDPALPWRATLTASAASGGNIELAGTIRSGDRVVGSPNIGAKPGEPFFFAVAGDGATPGYRIEGTLALADEAGGHAISDAPDAAAATASADRGAMYRLMRAPQYPADAVKQRVEGTVVVAATVAADGSVQDARVDRVEPSAAAQLGDAAVAAVKSWRFDPARADGKAMASRVFVPIAFSLGGNAPPAPSVPGALDTIYVSAGTGDGG